MSESTLFEKVKKQQEESYETWFDRWYRKIDLEKELMESSAKGYTGYKIPISDLMEQQNYLKRRLQDSRTVEKLRERLPDFKVEHKNLSGDRMLFGAKLGVWREEHIRISWED